MSVNGLAVASIVVIVALAIIFATRVIERDDSSHVTTSRLLPNRSRSPGDDESSRAVTPVKPSPALSDCDVPIPSSPASNDGDSPLPPQTPVKAQDLLPPPTPSSFEPRSLAEVDSLSIVTASTLPPSYRTQRSELDMTALLCPPAYDSPWCTIPPPSSAYLRGGRLRQQRPYGPRTSSSRPIVAGPLALPAAKADGITSLADTAGDEVVPALNHGAQQFGEARPQRRSMDGRVRIAGGPLGAPDRSERDIALVYGPEVTGMDSPAYLDT